MEGGSKTVPLALHGQAQELGLEQLCEEAAHAIRSSDILLVATGAGMSADSGLAVYKDIADVPAYHQLRMSYHDICRPEWLDNDSELFFGFWGSCFNDYRMHDPHEGYHTIRRWKDKYFVRGSERGAGLQELLEKEQERIVKKKRTRSHIFSRYMRIVEDHESVNIDGLKGESVCIVRRGELLFDNQPCLHDGKIRFRFHRDDLPLAGQFFFFTSNVDAHSFKVGFSPNEIYEIHGSIEVWQCGRNCSDEIWPAPKSWTFEVDRTTMRAPPKKSPQEQRRELEEGKQEAEEITPFEEKLRAEVEEDVARDDNLAPIPSAEEANAIQLELEQSCEEKEGLREKEGGGEANVASVEGEEECSCAQEAQHAIESSEAACVPIIPEEKKADDIEKEKEDEGVQASKQEEESEKRIVEGGREMEEEKEKKAEGDKKENQDSEQEARNEDNTQVVLVPERLDEEKPNEEEEAAAKPKENGLGYWDAVREIMKAEANGEEVISRKCEEENQPETENMHGFINNHPSCKNCRGLARPAILMFGDYSWHRDPAQEEQYEVWKSAVHHVVKHQPHNKYKVVVLEVGAGITVPTVRLQSQQWLNSMPSGSCTLIRINLDYPQAPEHHRHQTISIKAKALTALRMIDAYLKKAEEAEEQEQRKQQEAEETEQERERDSQEAEKPPSEELGLRRSAREEEGVLSNQSSRSIEEEENEVENGYMMDEKLAAETEGTKNEERSHSEDIEATHEVTQGE